MSENLLLKIVGEFEDGISGSLEKIASTGIPGLVGALAAAGAALVTMAVNATEVGDTLEEMSQQTGMTVEQLSEMNTALEVNNVSLDSFATANAKLAKNLIEAQDATSTQAKIFKELGIATTDTAGNIRNTSDVFADLADKWSKTANDGTKVAVTMELLGKSGRELIPMLNDGAEKMKEFNDIGKEFGKDWSFEQASQAAEFNDNLNLLNQAAEGLAQTLAKEMLPALLTITDEMVRSYREGGAMRDLFDGIVAITNSVVVPAMKVLAEVVAQVMGTFQQAGIAVGGFMAAAQQALSLDFGAASNTLKEMGKDIQRVDDDLAKFHDNLWNGAKKTEESTSKTKETLGNFAPILNSGKDATDASAKAAAKLADQYTKAESSLQQQLFALNNTGKTAQVAWENAYGTYAKFSEEQKANLLSIAKEIDLQTQLVEIYKKKGEWYDAYTEKLRESRTALEESTISDPTARAGQMEVDKHIAEVNKWAQAQRELIKNYNGEAKAIAEKNIVETVANETSEKTLQTYRNVGEEIEKNTQKMEVWNNAAGKNREEQTKLNFELEELNRLRAQNKITTDEYTTALERNSKAQLQVWANQSSENKRIKELILDDRIRLEELQKSKETLTKTFENNNKIFGDSSISAAEYTYKLKQLNDQIRNIDPVYTTDMLEKMNDEMKNAAASFEGMFSDYIFDAMQGKWNNLGDMVKQVIDRMVANMLAAQLQMMLFGDLGSTPAGKTPASTGMLGGIFSGIFGGGGSGLLGGLFKAEGGPVQAGKSYIVGERRPELFTPSTDGMISPSVNAGNNVTFNITAMDGQDVMRTLSKSKRDIAEMVFGASRQYNLSGAY